MNDRPIGLLEMSKLSFEEFWNWYYWLKRDVAWERWLIFVNHNWKYYDA